MRNANKRNGPNRSRPFSAHRSSEQVVTDPRLLTPRTYLRRGISLLEVLISFFILLLGVVMVITLFPIGVLNVQEAVKDTRSTITALEAQALVMGMGWPDDPYLLRPPHRGIWRRRRPPTPSPFGQPNPQATGQSPAGGDPRGIDPATTPAMAGTRPANDIYGTSPNFIFAPNVNNVYATVPNADGTMPPFPQTPTEIRRPALPPDGRRGAWLSGLRRPATGERDELSVRYCTMSPDWFAAVQADSDQHSRRADRTTSAERTSRR